MVKRLYNPLIARFAAVAALLILALAAPAVFAQEADAPSCAGNGGVECSYPENSDAPVADFDATDEDESDETIAWSLMDDADHDLFEISDGGVLTFKSPPNFEDAKDVGGDYVGDNIYEVTVLANKGKLKVLVTVTDMEEDGKVTLTQPQPQVEIQLTAKLTDGDGQINSTTWQWARSSDMSSWTDIDAARYSQLHAGDS